MIYDIYPPVIKNIKSKQCLNKYYWFVYAEMHESVVENNMIEMCHGTRPISLDP